MALIVMNKRQQIKLSTPNTHAHGPHQEDNCQGCQAQRSENKRLVDFYQRLTQMQIKVQRIKENIGAEQQVKQSQKEEIDKMAALMQSKPDKAIHLIKEQNPKQMGYELASALIQRQIKVKTENERLQGVIEQLQRQKIKMEEQKRQPSLAQTNATQSPGGSNTQATGEFYQKASPSRYTDVLDEVRRTNSNGSTYFRSKKTQNRQTNRSYFDEGQQSKKYWQSSEGQGETNFSTFTVPTKKNTIHQTSEKSNYNGLNLWLYQYKTEDLDDNPIKALRKPAAQMGKSPQGGKYKSKF